MAEPGHTDFPQLGLDDDCVRLCFCCCTGLTPIQVGYVEPKSVYIDEFWQLWHQIAFDAGHELHIVRDGMFHPGPDELWIAVVPSLVYRNGHSAHAIVMKGERIYHDFNFPARQRVRQIWFAIRVKPVA